MADGGEGVSKYMYCTGHCGLHPMNSDDRGGGGLGGREDV